MSLNAVRWVQFVIGLAALLSVTAGCAGGMENVVPPSPPSASSADVLMPEEARRMSEQSAKYSSQLKHLISQSQPGEHPDLNLMVQVANSPTPPQLKQIEDLGGKVRTIAGNILTLTLPFDSVAQLAGLDFVTSIEVSSPLYPES